MYFKILKSKLVLDLLIVIINSLDISILTQFDK